MNSTDILPRFILHLKLAAAPSVSVCLSLALPRPNVTSTLSLRTIFDSPDRKIPAGFVSISSEIDRPWSVPSAATLSIGLSKHIA
jgi:hypothetical protein